MLKVCRTSTGIWHNHSFKSRQGYIHKCSNPSSLSQLTEYFAPSIIFFFSDFFQGRNSANSQAEKYSTLYYFFLHSLDPLSITSSKLSQFLVSLFELTHIVAAVDLSQKTACNFRHQVARTTLKKLLPPPYINTPSLITFRISLTLFFKCSHFALTPLVGTAAFSHSWILRSTNLSVWRETWGITETSSASGSSRTKSYQD